jgi:hypothetical protein
MIRTLRLFVLGALLSLVVSAASAGASTITFDISVACTSATIIVRQPIQPNGVLLNRAELIIAPYLYIDLHNVNTGELLGRKIKYLLVSNGVTDVVMSATFTFEPQTPGDTLRFTFGQAMPDYDKQIAPMVEVPLHVETRIYTGEGCGGQSSACRDGRVNEATCELAAIYPVADEEGFGMSFWFVDHETGDGYFGFYVPAEDLMSLPESPEEAILLAQSEDGKAVLYWLPSNEFQLNIGPDWEGKMHILRFPFFPGVEPTHETYWP